MSNFPGIAEPAPTVESLLVTVQALKETVEILIGARGPAPRSARSVSFDDLITMELIIADQIP